MLGDTLRALILTGDSIASVAKQSGVPQATLQEFVAGRSDGNYPDIRLSTVERLLDFYELDRLFVDVTKPQKKGIRRMRLSTELQACGCTDSPEKFKERLVETLETEFPGKTIDDLLCQPDDAIKYCELITDQVGAEWLPHAVILKALQNIRKSKQCPTNLKPRRTRISLEASLKSAECNCTPVEFRDLVIECIASMYRDITIDVLLANPRQAKDLCRFVRRMAESPLLEDHLILRTAMNSRKAARS